MSEPERRDAERNAGAFLSPAGPLVVPPMRTLSDEYRDEPAEPEDSDRMPEPEPPGWLRRLVGRVRRELPGRR